MSDRIRAESGFTMITVMTSMLAVMLLSAAAIATASGDLNLSRYDQDDKQALAAAEAGVNDYLGHLNNDKGYWSKCTGVSAPTPVNQLGTTAASVPPRKWRRLPGTNTRYSIELVPATGYSTCDTANATQSMIEDGNVKIRVTGNVIGTDNYRTVNTTFRPGGFLDFLWYTKYENQDLIYFKSSFYYDLPSQSASQGTFQTWAASACNQYWWGPGGRGTNVWNGEVRYNNEWYDVSLSPELACGNIQFVTGDSLDGPFHSNDDIVACGTPSFGSVGGGDRVEVSGPGANGVGYRASCDPTNPTFRPNLVNNAATLDPPASNDALKAVTPPAYTFTGRTKIVLNGATMTVTNPNYNGGAATSVALPSNGVIYVANGATCSTGYDPYDSEQTFRTSNTCGDAQIEGNYSKDLTIAAENDVVITEDTRKTTGTDALLGLIPNGFARIWHPSTGSTSSVGSDCTTASNSPRDVILDAAVLTLSGSFTVDNYWCDGALGTLTVNGALAQTHRGVVGRGGGSNMTGYLKDYNYNRALRYRSPPYFLDPLRSEWRVLRQGEQTPPVRG